MKGLGNYRFPKAAQGAPPNIERRPAIVLSYRGPKAIVRFHDGNTYSIPAKPLKDIGVQEGQRFRLIIARVAGAVQDVRVERLAAPRPARVVQAMPKVQVRDGRKLTTRK